MISEDVRSQIAKGESINTAFVADPSDFAGIASDVCAFLNMRGGVLFVGVNPAGHIVGIEGDPEAMRRSIEIQLQKSISPKAYFTVSVDVEGGASLVSIDVPQGIDVPYLADGQFYVRRGLRTTVVASEELRQTSQRRSIQAERWERRPAVDIEESELDSAEILAVVEESRRQDRFPFSGKEDVHTVLRSLGLLTSGGLTQACDVLFSPHPDQRHPQCRARFIVYTSDKVGDSFADTQWIVGPLVPVLMQLVERLGAHVRVQALFHPDSTQRKDRPNYSLDALREGLVNAVAHRDYASFSGGVSVSVFPNRVEIWNSGRLPTELKVSDLKRPHPSVPVNPDICHVLYLRALMERVGRGTQKIIQACAELGAPSPKWEDLVSGVTLTLYSADSKGSSVVVLNERQTRLMERLRQGDSLHLREYIEIEHGIPERTARRDLSELEAAGLLIKVGRGRATSYRRSERTV